MTELEEWIDLINSDGVSSVANTANDRELTMARPTKKTKALVKSARQYLDSFEIHGHAIPSIVGMARIIGVARSTLYAWADDEDDDEFSDILEQCNEYQEFELLNNGLKDNFNASITKLCLGKHGYHDKQEVGLGELDDLNISVTYE